MIPRPLGAVIFDMDGTLLDTERLYRRALFGACDALGYAMTDALFLSLIGSPHEQNRLRLTQHFGADFPLGHCEEAAHGAFIALCAAELPLRPGAAALLAQLAAEGVPLGIATSTRRDRALVLLEQAGILGYFGAVVTRTDVTHGKPHPECFLAAAAALDAAPAACVALEDSYAGVRAAAAAGMAVIMVPDMLAATDEMHHLCATIVPSLEHVAELIADRESARDAA